MKNIHLYPTKEKSQLYKVKDSLCFEEFPINSITSGNLYVYITDNKKTEDNDWFISNTKGREGVYKCKSTLNDSILAEDETYLFYQNTTSKIIMTNDLKLTKEGVEEVGEDFLKWLVDNPSNEFIETYSLGISNGVNSSHYKYEIIYPEDEIEKGIVITNVSNKKEAIPETIEEIAGRMAELQEGTYTSQHQVTYKHGFIDGYKQAVKDSYNSKEIEILLETLSKVLVYQGNEFILPYYFQKEINQVIHDFKNK